MIRFGPAVSTMILLAAFVGKLIRIMDGPTMSTSPSTGVFAHPIAGHKQLVGLFRFDEIFLHWISRIRKEPPRNHPIFGGVPELTNCDLYGFLMEAAGIEAVSERCSHFDSVFSDLV